MSAKKQERDFEKLYLQQMAQNEQQQMKWQQKEIEYQRRVIAMQKFIEDEKLEDSFNAFLSNNMSSIDSFINKSIERKSLPPGNPYGSAASEKTLIDNQFEKKQLSIGALRDIDASVIIDKPLKQYTRRTGGDRNFNQVNQAGSNLGLPETPQMSAYDQLNTHQSMLSNNFFGEEAIQMIMGSHVQQVPDDGKNARTNYKQQPQLNMYSAQIKDRNRFESQQIPDTDVQKILSTSLDFDQDEKLHREHTNDNFNETKRNPQNYGDSPSSDLEESPVKNQTVISLSNIMKQVGQAEQSVKKQFSQKTVQPHSRKISFKADQMELTPEKSMSPINAPKFFKHSRNKVTVKQSATTRPPVQNKKGALEMIQDAFGLQRGSQALPRSPLKKMGTFVRGTLNRSQQAISSPEHSAQRSATDAYMGQGNQRRNTDVQKAQRPYLSRPASKMSMNSYLSGSNKNVEHTSKTANKLKSRNMKTDRKSDSSGQSFLAQHPEFKSSRSFYVSPKQGPGYFGNVAHPFGPNQKIKLHPGLASNKTDQRIFKYDGTPNPNQNVKKIKLIETQGGFIDESNKSDSGHSNNFNNNYFPGLIGTQMPEVPSENPADLSIISVEKPTPSRLSKRETFSSNISQQPPRNYTQEKNILRPASNLQFSKQKSDQVQPSQRAEFFREQTNHKEKLNEFLNMQIQSNLNMKNLDQLEQIEKVKDNLFENTKQEVMFGVIEPKKSFGPFQGYKEGDENVRESVVVQSPEDRLQQVQSNNYARMSIETNTLRVKSRLSQSPVTEGLVNLQKRHNGLMQLEQVKIEKQKTVIESPNKLLAQDSDSDINDRDDPEQTQLLMDQIFPGRNSSLSRLQQENNNILSRAEVDSDVESRTSADQQLQGGFENQKRQSKASNFNMELKRYFSKSEAIPQIDDQKSQKKFVININQIEKRLVTAESQKNNILGSKIHYRNPTKVTQEHLTEEEEGYNATTIFNNNYSGPRQRGQTLQEQNSYQKDAQKLDAYSAYNAAYNFSYNGRSLRDRAGTLLLAKSNGNSLVNQDPEYKNDMLASVVNMKLDVNQMSFHNKSMKNQKFKMSMKKRPQEGKLSANNSQSKFSALMRNNSNFRNSVQEQREDTLSQNMIRSEINGESGPDSLNKQLSRDNLMIYRQNSLTSIKEDEESGVQLESSQILQGIDGAQPNQSRNILDQSITINSFRVSRATKNIQFQGNFKNRENIDVEEEQTFHQMNTSQIVTPDASPILEKNKTQPLINDSLPSGRLFAAKNSKSMVTDNKDQLFEDTEQLTQKFREMDIQNSLQPQEQPYSVMPKEMDQDSIQSITFGQSGKLKSKILGMKQQRILNEEYTDMIHQDNCNSTLLMPTTSPVLTQSKILDFLPNRQSLDIDNFEKIKKKLNQKYQAKIMEFARFKKLKSTRLFEQFYTIGLLGDDMERILLKKEKVVSDFYEQNNESMGDQEDDYYDQNLGNLAAQKIYRYPNVAKNKDIEIRSKVIQDWVFPNGIKYQKIDDVKNQNVQDVFKEMLYEIQKTRENTFIFTLCENFDSQENKQAAEEAETMSVDVQKSENGIDNYFNCLCVKYKTVIQRPSDGQLFLVDQAFCMLSRNNFFVPQYEFIDKLLRIINIHSKINQNNHQHKNYILAENFLMVDYRDELNYQCIKQLYEVKLIYDRTMSQERYSNQFPLGFKIELDVRINDRPEVDELNIVFEYQFPLSVKECYSFGFEWHVPLVLSIFKDIGLILKLLTALILERSTVFVSEDPVKLSSVILGLNTMMKPLEWSFGLIPILSDNLLEYLDAPQAILVGITQKSYDNLLKIEDLDSEFIESKTWVYLDHFDNLRNKGKFLNPMSQYGQDSQQMNSSKLTPIDWCQGEEQPSFQEYHWYKEYPKLDLLQSKLLEFLACQSDPEMMIYSMNEKQRKKFNQFYELFNEMMSFQILKYINLSKIRQENQRIMEHNKNPANQSHKIDENKKMDLFRQLILAECDNQKSLLEEEIKNNPSCIDFERSLNPQDKDCSLALIQRLSIMSTTKNDIQSPEVENLQGDSTDVKPFLESLVYTQSFQQLIQDLVKRSS